jgi:hypothetical protein
MRILKENEIVKHGIISFIGNWTYLIFCINIGVEGLKRWTHNFHFVEFGSIHLNIGATNL